MVAKFFPDNIVRILRKRGGPELPEEIGIVVKVLFNEDTHLVDMETLENPGPTPPRYRVVTMENCPPDCPLEDEYAEDELEFVSWGISTDIFQFS